MAALLKDRILVTGGAGFIGAYICKKLMEEGYQPVIYDAFIQYISPFQSSYQKYLELRFSDFKEQVIFERGDIRNKEDLRRVILKFKPRIIFHLAALPIADLSFSHPEEAIGSILNGSVNLLDVIRDLEFVERLVYASSSMVYGDFMEIPATEEHPKKPKDVYGGTKLAGEILIEAYGRRYGVKYTIIRPSAVYGPTDVNRRVVQIFLENALKGEDLVLYGGSENVLDFTYIKDCANGFVLAGLSKGGENEIFNITGGHGRSLSKCAQIIKEYFPRIGIKVKPMKMNRPKRGTLSIEKAKKLLKYQPRYSLEKGIEEYIRFYNRFYQ